ncbi:MAG: helix-hairpin-helix domain-containing protein [Flavobacteriales bacterium]|nr:helix-hairpin-helix domain-containing protein [Flavobacteriales bacterium]
MRHRPGQRPWKEGLKDLFTLHAAERRGMGLLLVVFFLAAAWVVYEQYIASDVLEDKAAVRFVGEMRAASGSSIAEDQRSDRQSFDEKAVLFKFDPNKLPVEQWVTLGLSERQAASIHRYEAKGGQFRTKRDVAKMHVVDSELYARWEPFILLPDSFERKTFADRKRYREFERDDPARVRSPERSSFVPKAQVEINTADTSRLVEVRGIGPAFARSIVKYRDRLGGFHSLDQLSEVYILRDKPEAVAELKSRLLLDTLMVRRFPLNSFTAEELGPHPYAGWKVAKALVAYRKQHGPFKTVADIKGCVLVTDSVYRKLVPYLSAE